MTAAHLHLMVVHIPVLFCPLGLVFLCLDRQRPVIGYGLLAFSGLMAIVAYYSGPPAYEQLETVLVSEKEWVERHAVLGRAAFVAMVLVAVLAVQALIRGLQEEEISRGLKVAILAVACVAVYLLMWTAHLGGQIRHVEIREGAWSIFPTLPE